jgi:poly-gamma-glutamate synthesis protein (capsule biosynthesis protein)
MGAERTGQPITLAITALVAASIAGAWGFVLAPAEPFGSPIRVVRDSLLPGVSPSTLPGHGMPAADTVRLGFAGDVMQHRAQADDDFRRSYAEVSPLLRGFDLAVANLEFPVDTTQPIGPEGASTRFNGSARHLDALAEAGFDLLSLANNHALDRGPAGLVRTVNAVRARGMVPAGAAETRELLERAPALIERKGIRIAVRAYTFVPNVYADSTGRPEWPPPDAPVDVLDFVYWDGASRAQGVARTRSHVAQARAAGADFVVAVVHWGKEWYLRPTDDQRRAAHDLIEAGFDLVVGSHGHVLNGAEIFDGKLIAYSLGNLISDFRPPVARTGAVLEVDISRGPDRRVRVTDFSFHPVVVQTAGHVVHLVRAGGDDATGAWHLARELLGEGVRDAAR